MDFDDLKDENAKPVDLGLSAEDQATMAQYAQNPDFQKQQQMIVDQQNLMNMTPDQASQAGKLFLGSVPGEDPKAIAAQLQPTVSKYGAKVFDLLGNIGQDAAQSATKIVPDAGFGKIVQAQGPAQTLGKVIMKADGGAVSFDQMQSDTPQPTQTSAAAPQGDFDSLQDDKAKYETPGQMAATVAEGAAEGALGPLATAAEVRLGFAKPSEIRARKEANPNLHTAGQVGGFGGSLISGEGIAPLISGIGEKAAAQVAIENAPKLTKIAQSGVRTGSEMATLAAGDELSKMITEDPSQSVGTAAANVGLSALIGGVGGSAIGAVSPLWKSAVESSKLPDIIDNAKAQYAFRQANPDLVTGATSELGGRIAEVNEMHNTLGDLKADTLAKVLPEVSDKSTARINEQLGNINEKLTTQVEKAANDAYLRGAVPKLAQHLTEFQDVLANDSASYADKFKAADDLKRAMQGLSKYGATAEDSALSKLAKKSAFEIRTALEDSKVWGEAANVQKETNEALSKSFQAQKDFTGKFTSKLGGDQVIDPNKVQTYLNQADKGKLGLKGNIVQNYLDATQKVADQINKIHASRGLETPIESTLNPTPVINHSLGEVSHGTHLGNWLYEKGLGDSVGNSAAGGVGATLGAVIGHPVVGSIVGEKVLGPTFRAIARPLMESATNSAAMKSAIDYTAAIVKGEKLITSAAKNLFKAGAQILPQGMYPSEASRDKLKKTLTAINDNPASLQKVGGNVGYYLPDHTSTLSATAMTAINYLDSLKPQTVQNNMLDTPPPEDKVALQQYNRAIDIAQQPLVVLDHVKNGSIQTSDVTALKTMYPGLYSKLVNQVGQELVESKTEGVNLSYSQKLGISTFLGMPIDSTMTPGAIQTIMKANAGAEAPSQQAPAGKMHATSAVTAQMQRKSNSLLETPLQSRQAHRTQS